MELFLGRAAACAALVALSLSAHPGCSRGGATSPAPRQEPATSARDASPEPVRDNHTSPVRDAATRAGQAPPSADDDLVDITSISPSVRVDIRYATKDNFTGVAVYPLSRCLLRRAVARRLARVQEALDARGLGLLVWDCYRPVSVQQRFWELVPDRRYVAEVVFEDGVPVEGSKHNRGAAVDVTLVDASGHLLEMPTGFDDFSEAAHRDSKHSSPTARTNMRILEENMVAQGFLPLATEWWHFDAPDWRQYPLSDQPLR